MKLVIDIDTDEYEQIKGYYDALPKDSTVDAETFYIANGKPLNGTNGEALKAVFPNAIIAEDTEHDCLSISNDFWNAPYKRGDL